MNFLWFIAYKTIYWIIFLIGYKQGFAQKLLHKISFCCLTFPLGKTTGKVFIVKFWGFFLTDSIYYARNK